MEFAAPSTADARAESEREVHQLVRTRSPPTTSPVAKHSLGAGPRTTSRHPPTLDVPTSFCASLLSAPRFRKSSTLSVEREQSLGLYSPRRSTNEPGSGLHPNVLCVRKFRAHVLPFDPQTRNEPPAFVPSP